MPKAIVEWNGLVDRPMNRVWRQPHNYLEGSVITAQGIVYAYTQGGRGITSAEEESTTLQFVHRGRLHSRTIPRRYTSRGLVTVARRFAEEISNPNPTRRTL